MEPQGPVAREAYIDEIVEELRGAALESWKRKWARLVSDLLRIYGVEDPQVIGLGDPSDPDDVIQFIMGHCSGLTESECAKKIEQIIRDYGFSRSIEEVARRAIDELRYWEEKEEAIEKAVRLFKLPVLDLPPDAAEKLLEIYDNPELNHDTVFDIIISELRALGMPEEEARRIAEESARVIDELLEKKRERALAVAHWTQILRHDVQQERKRLGRKREKAEERLRRFIEELLRGREKAILSVTELHLIGFEPTKARARSLPEALEKLKQMNAIEAKAVAAPAKVFYFTEKNMCRAKLLEKFNRWVIEKCEEPVIVVKVKAGRVYYQVVGGGSG